MDLRGWIGWFQPSTLENLNLFVPHDKIIKIDPLPHPRLANKIITSDPPLPKSFWICACGNEGLFNFMVQINLIGLDCSVKIKMRLIQYICKKNLWHLHKFLGDSLFYWCVQKLGNMMVIYKCACMYNVFHSGRVLHAVSSCWSWLILIWVSDFHITCFIILWFYIENGTHFFLLLSIYKSR